MGRRLEFVIPTALVPGVSAMLLLRPKRSIGFALWSVPTAVASLGAAMNVALFVVTAPVIALCLAYKAVGSANEAKLNHHSR
jgi:hypothetical protein